MRALRAILVLVVVVIVVGLLAGWMMVRRGFSAREQPSAIEAEIADFLREAAIPAGAKHAQNPVPLTPEVLKEARDHFADHCATCHANNGSGNTPIGQNVYPKPPDMRQRETQQMSDGEIYYIIHNGVRLTAMPAWGDPQGRDLDSWKLVHFIRHLPALTAEEEAEMRKVNPRSPEELREEKEEEEFLSGGQQPAGGQENQQHHHH